MQSFRLFYLTALVAFAAASNSTGEEQATSQPDTPKNPSLKSENGNLMFSMPASGDVMFRRPVEAVGVMELFKELNELKARHAAMQSTEAELMTTVNTLKSTITAFEAAAASVSRVDTLIEDQTKSAINFGKQVRALPAQIENFNNEMRGNIAKTTKSVQDLQSFVATSVASSLRLATAQINDKTNSVLSTLAAGDNTNKAKLTTAEQLFAAKGVAFKCAERDQLYDPAAKTCRTRYWTRHFNNEDHRENGWLSNRRLTFTKWRDDTMLKITYHDNMRVHGGNWCRANWRVHIDRSECNDPGVIRFTKYNHIQRNFWMNFHVGGSAHGVCRRTGKGDIRKGQHTIEVYVATDRCDTHTGHNGQGGYIIVEETALSKN